MPTAGQFMMQTKPQRQDMLEIFSPERQAGLQISKWRGHLATVCLAHTTFSRELKHCQYFSSEVEGMGYQNVPGA